VTHLCLCNQLGNLAGFVACCKLALLDGKEFVGNEEPGQALNCKQKLRKKSGTAFGFQKKGGNKAEPSCAAAENVK